MVFLNQMSIHILGLMATRTEESTSVEELTKIMEDDSVSGGEKTSFLIQYLLDQREPLLRFGQTLLIALIVFLLGRRLVKLLLKLTQRSMEHREVEISVRKFVMSLAGFIYNLLLIVVVAGILGIGTSSIVAVIGSAGLAIGLALQGSLSNLAGGVLILLLKPFQVGDYIITDNSEGTVQSIDIFYTRLHTSDNRVVVIPNGAISNRDVTNTTKLEKRLLVLPFSVGYDADIATVRELLLKEMEEHSDIIQAEPKSVVVTKLNPVKVCLSAKCWVETGKYWDVNHMMLERIKELLQEQGISIG
ncbi:MAG: mechanosensitive ion channel [Lachnospiraceae bacterium]|nr:mechanosensitive ion channel [Lachnospiraceae bacterium]